MSRHQNRQQSKCELCGVQCKPTLHHLVPQVRCKNKYKEAKNDPDNYLWVCDSCHGHIHATFTENELRDLYNTKEKLLSSEEMQKFIRWKIKHPDFSGHSKMNNDRKHRR